MLRLFLDVQFQGQLANELLKLGNSLLIGIGLFISRFKECRRVIKEVAFPPCELFFAEIMLTSEFRL